MDKQHGQASIHFSDRPSKLKPPLAEQLPSMEYSALTRVFQITALVSSMVLTQLACAEQQMPVSEPLPTPGHSSQPIPMGPDIQQPPVVSVKPSPPAEVLSEKEKELKELLDVGITMCSLDPQLKDFIGKGFRNNRLTFDMVDTVDPNGIQKLLQEGGIQNPVQVLQQGSGTDPDALTSSVMLPDNIVVHYVQLRKSALKNPADALSLVNHESIHALRKELGKSESNDTLEEVEVTKASIQSLSNIAEKLEKALDMTDEVSQRTLAGIRQHIEDEKKRQADFEKGLKAPSQK